MSARRTHHESLKDDIERLNDIQQLEIYKIVRKYTDQCTKTDTGVFISVESLTDECLQVIADYISFCNNQKSQEDAIEYEKRRLVKLMKPIT